MEKKEESKVDIGGNASSFQQHTKQEENY